MFGKENVVSAVLHLDESTPHIHATVVPIVTGERRKARQEQVKNSGKRTYRKKKDTPRLCADDVMSRPKLKEYQTTYAETMAKFGLARGIDGSEAKHITGSQFYREVFVRKNEIAEQVANLKKQQQTLSVDITALKAQQADAQAGYHTIDGQRRKKQQELEQAKRELTKTQVKQKAAAATETVLDGIVSLFDDSKQKKVRQEIDALKQQNTDLRSTIGTMLTDHAQEQAQLKHETATVRNELARVYGLFPQVRGLLRWESYCRSIGLNQEWTKALFTLRPYKFTGELTSTEFQRPFHAQDAILQFRPDKDGPGGFRFTIDGKDDGEWFRQQRNDAIKRITGIDVERNLKIKRGI